MGPVQQLPHGGSAAELCAREKKDRPRGAGCLCAESYRRRPGRAKEGKFDEEIVKGRGTAEEGTRQGGGVDEEPTRADLAKMGTLRPAFEKKDGTITAANASKINDGAAAVVLMSGSGSGSRPAAPLVAS